MIIISGLFCSVELRPNLATDRENIFQKPNVAVEATFAAGFTTGHGLEEYLTKMFQRWTDMYIGWFPAACF